MGGELVNPVPPPSSWTKQFEDVCPWYLSIGMTYEQFWDGDCTAVRFYREAYKIKARRQNQEAWLQGLYIYDALCCVSPVLHAFAKKGTTVTPYPSEPYPLSKEDAAQKNKEENEQNADKAIAFMHMFATNTNRKFERQEIAST